MPFVERWRPDRFSLDEAARGYRYFRIVPPQGSERAEYDTDASKGYARVIEHPRIPRTPMREEDQTIARVPMARSIWSAIGAVFGTQTGEGLRSNPKALEEFGPQVKGWFIYGTRSGSKVRKDVSRYVPDARVTGEVWATSPVKLSLIGRLDGGFGEEPQRFGRKVIAVVDRGMPEDDPAEYGEGAFVDWVHETLGEAYKRRVSVPTFDEALSMARDFNFEVSVREKEEVVDRPFVMWVVR